MTILLIAGSPTEQSRSGSLLNAVAEHIKARGERPERLAVRQLPADALLHADFAHPAVLAANAAVRSARAVVIATPVYKAAYSGALKTLLDLLPQDGLAGKVVLPLATGGSPHHMLAIDYALRPVLQSLAARHILPGVYATDAQLPKRHDGGYRLSDDIAARIDNAVQALLKESPGRMRPAPAVPFSQVRCSV